MAYSTIVKKRCKCTEGCSKYPTLGCFGYYYGHLPDDLKEKVGNKHKLQVKNKNKRTALAAKLRQVGSEDNVDIVNSIYL